MPQGFLMIKNVVGADKETGRRLLSNWRASLIILLLYVALLLVIYVFLSTMVATVGQVIINGLTVLIAPVIFFVIQAMGVSYMAHEAGASESSAGRQLKRALNGFWKLVVVSIPIVLLGWLLAYLIGQIPAGTAAAAHEAVRTASAPVRTAAHRAPQPIDWRGVAVAALQFLIYGIALPLAAANLWIATARDGLGPAIKRAHRTLYRSF